MSDSVKLQLQDLNDKKFEHFIPIIKKAIKWLSENKYIAKNSDFYFDDDNFYISPEHHCFYMYHGYNCFSGSLRRDAFTGFKERIIPKDFYRIDIYENHWKITTQALRKEGTWDLYNKIIFEEDK